MPSGLWMISPPTPPSFFCCFWLVFPVTHLAANLPQTFSRCQQLFEYIYFPPFFQDGTPTQRQGRGGGRYMGVNKRRGKEGRCIYVSLTARAGGGLRASALRMSLHAHNLRALSTSHNILLCLLTYLCMSLYCNEISILASRHLSY